MKEEFKHENLSEDILSVAADITLADLLETPAAQAWIISAIGNIVQNTQCYSVVEDDYVTLAKLTVVNNLIPRKVRTKKYYQCSRLIEDRKREMQE